MGLNYVKNEVENSLESSRLIYELEQCRADHRGSNSTIVNIIVAGVAALGLLFALFSNPAIMERVDKNIIILLFCSVTSAVIAFISNVGLVSTLRYFYMRELEEKLASLSKYGCEIYGWNELSAPLTTMNFSHAVSRRESRIHYINCVLAIVFALLACVFLLLLFGIDDLIGWKLARNFLILLPVFFLLIFSWHASTAKAKDLYIFAKEQVKAKRTTEKIEGGSNQSSCNSQPVPITWRKFVGYLFFPRSSALIKTLFILFGFALGSYLLAYANGQDWKILLEELLRLVFVYFILDVMTYQARYQWNDIRGYEEDTKNSEAKNRRRLSEVCKNPRVAVGVSFPIMVLKIVGAVLLTFPNWFSVEMGIPLRWGILAILILGVLYEIFRSNKMGCSTIFTVGFGYAFRFMFSLWAAWPGIFGQIGIISNNFLLAVFFLILSTYMFGLVFVTLSWALEAADNNGSEREHIKMLYSQLGGTIKEYPLQEKGEIVTWWNCSFFIMIVMLAVSMLFIVEVEIASIISIVVWAAASIACALVENKKIYSRWIALGICVVPVLVIIFGGSLIGTSWFGLHIFVAVAMIFYPLIYVYFRHVNYKILCNASIKKLFMFILKKLFMFIFRLLWGKPTFDMVFHDKRDE